MNLRDIGHIARLRQLEFPITTKENSLPFLSRYQPWIISSHICLYLFISFQRDLDCLVMPCRKLETTLLPWPKYFFPLTYDVTPTSFPWARSRQSSTEARRIWSNHSFRRKKRWRRRKKQEGQEKRQNSEEIEGSRREKFKNFPPSARKEFQELWVMERSKTPFSSGKENSTKNQNRGLGGGVE